MERQTRGEGEKDRGDETGKDGGGERERGKKPSEL